MNENKNVARFSTIEDSLRQSEELTEILGYPSLRTVRDRENNVKSQESRVITHYSLLVTRYLLLITYYLLLITYYLLLVTRYSLLATYVNLLLFYLQNESIEKWNHSSESCFWLREKVIFSLSNINLL
jgi:hypothetical protein